MKKIFAFFLFVVMCLSTFFISAKDNNVLKYNGSEEVATDTIKNKKKKSVDEIEDEDVLMLEPSSLVIQTVPKKAKVYIDDELRGTTPLKIKNIVPDKYEIRIEKKGYEEIRETISIDEGEDFVFDEILNEIVEIEPETAAVENTEDVATEEIKEKKTKKSKSSLYVETVPKKADVYLNDDLKGTSPLKIKNLTPDEYEFKGEIVGNYGPYIQSERKEIYHAFIKHLIEIGRAYPCFCKEEDLDSMRKMQERKSLKAPLFPV